MLFFFFFLLFFSSSSLQSSPEPPHNAHPPIQELFQANARVSAKDRDAFDKVDVLLVPTAAAQAPKLSDYNDMSIEQVYALDALTVPASLAGLPAISLPVGVGPADMPVAVQVISPRLQVMAVDCNTAKLCARA